MDFGADERRDLRDLGLARGQQVREGRVGVLAVVVVLEGLEGRVSGYEVSRTKINYYLLRKSAACG